MKKHTKILASVKLLMLTLVLSFASANAQTYPGIVLTTDGDFIGKGWVPADVMDDQNFNYSVSVTTVGTTSVSVAATTGGIKNWTNGKYGYKFGIKPGVKATFTTKGSINDNFEKLFNNESSQIILYYSDVRELVAVKEKIDALGLTDDDIENIDWERLNDIKDSFTDSELLIIFNYVKEQMPDEYEDYTTYSDYFDYYEAMIEEDEDQTIASEAYVYFFGMLDVSEEAISTLTMHKDLSNLDNLRVLGQTANITFNHATSSFLPIDFSNFNNPSGGTFTYGTESVENIALDLHSGMKTYYNLTLGGSNEVSVDHNATVSNVFTHSASAFNIGYNSESETTSDAVFSVGESAKAKINADVYTYDNSVLALLNTDASSTSGSYKVYGRLRRQMAASLEYSFPVAISGDDNATSFTVTPDANSALELKIAYDENLSYVTAGGATADATYTFPAYYLTAKTSSSFSGQIYTPTIIGGSPTSSTYMFYRSSNSTTWNKIGFEETAADFYFKKVQNNKNASIIICSGAMTAGVDYYFAFGTIDSSEPTWSGATSTDWDNESNWASGYSSRTGNVTIPAGCSNYPVITTSNGDLNIKSITIESGATLTVDEGVSLIVTSGITNNGTIVMNHSAFNDGTYGKGTASLSADITGNGNAVVNRILAGGRVYYIGSTVKSGSLDVSCTKASSYDPAYRIRTLDATTYQYSDELTSFSHGGIGSSFQYKGTGKVTVSETGAIYSKSDVIELTGLGTDADTTFGWHLLNNPFPFAITTEAISVGGNAQNKVYYRYLPAGSSNYTDAVVAGGLSSTSDENVFAPGQSFFILVDAADSQNGTGSVTIDPSQMTTSVGGGVSIKSLRNISDALHISLSTEKGKVAEFAYSFSNAGSFSKSANDAQAFFGIGEEDNSNSNYIYAIKGTTPLFIATYPCLGALYNQNELPIGVRISADADATKPYTISATDIAMFSEDFDIYINDKLNGNRVNLREQDYSFLAQPGTEINDRFTITFFDNTFDYEAYNRAEDEEDDDNGVITVIDEVAKAQLSIRQTSKSIEVSTNEADAQVNAVVYDIFGRVVAKQASKGKATLSIGKVGLYIVKANSGTLNASRKVIVK